MSKPWNYSSQIVMFLCRNSRKGATRKIFLTSRYQWSRLKNCYKRAGLSPGCGNSCIQNMLNLWRKFSVLPVIPRAYSVWKGFPANRTKLQILLANFVVVVKLFGFVFGKKYLNFAENTSALGLSICLKLIIFILQFSPSLVEEFG